MAVLRAKGRTLGAPVKFDKVTKREARRLLKMRERRKVRGKSVWRAVYKKKDIAKQLRISSGTLHNWIRGGMK